jgi:hypothetical protein
MDNITGPVFKPCFSSVKEFKTSCESTVVSATKDFRNEYAKHIEALSIIADCGKIYILENYKKINDWTDLDLHIKSGTKQATGKTHFYKHDEIKINKKGSMEQTDDVFIKMNETSRLGENPIKTLTNVILDPSDGDFSLTINDLEFWWICDDSIITIAHYIEFKIKDLNI